MYKFKLKEIEVGDTEIKGGKKSTVTDIDPETGAISWDVADVADFSSTYKALKKAKDFLDTLEKTGKSKDDEAIDQFAEEIANLFNSFRTHVRKNYPKEYERVSRLKEEETEEKEEEGTRDVNTIEKFLPKINNKAEWGELLGKVLNLEIPTVNDNTKKQALLKIIKQLKEEEVNKDSSEKLSIMKDENGKFIIGMAKGKYPRSKEAGPFDTQQKACEFFSKKGDVILKNLTEERLNEIDINKLQVVGDVYSSCEIPVNEEEVDEGEGIGYLTPRAFNKNKKSTGAPDIYYYKLGFKPVPKTKPKGFEVKQLFEKTDRNEFQGKRIAAFKEIEERLNQIYPLLSNAKDETAEYYNENPGSYAIVYSTDYIFELLDEVEAKLKQSE